MPKATFTAVGSGDDASTPSDPVTTLSAKRHCQANSSNFPFLPTSTLLPLATKSARVKSRTKQYAMGSLFESLPKKSFFPAMPRKGDLPISQSHEQAKETHLIGLRKRISSFSVKIQPLSTASAEWAAFRRSKSMPSLGEFAGGPLRRWWNQWWGWVLSRKPTFAQDIEMNEDETAMLGSHSRGTLRHVFYKVRAEIRKLTGSYTLPTTHQGFRYDSFSYAQNFDHGKSLDQQ